MCGCLYVCVFTCVCVLSVCVCVCVCVCTYTLHTFTVCVFAWFVGGRSSMHLSLHVHDCVVDMHVCVYCVYTYVWSFPLDLRSIVLLF